jgi:hypothetical protein
MQTYYDVPLALDSNGDPSIIVRMRHLSRAEKRQIRKAAFEKSRNPQLAATEAGEALTERSICGCSVELAAELGIEGSGQDADGIVTFDATRAAPTRLYNGISSKQRDILSRRRIRPPFVSGGDSDDLGEQGPMYGPNFDPAHVPAHALLLELEASEEQRRREAAKLDGASPSWRVGRAAPRVLTWAIVDQLIGCLMVEAGQQFAALEAMTVRELVRAYGCRMAWAPNEAPGCAWVTKRK